MLSIITSNVVYDTDVTNSIILSNDTLCYLHSQLRVVNIFNSRK